MLGAGRVSAALPFPFPLTKHHSQHAVTWRFSDESTHSLVIPLPTSQGSSKAMPLPTLTQYSIARATSHAKSDASIRSGSHCLYGTVLAPSYAATSSDGTNYSISSVLIDVYHHCILISRVPRPALCRFSCSTVPSVSVLFYFPMLSSARLRLLTKPAIRMLINTNSGSF